MEHTRVKPLPSPPILAISRQPLSSLSVLCLSLLPTRGVGHWCTLFATMMMAMMVLFLCFYFCFSKRCSGHALNHTNNHATKRMCRYTQENACNETARHPMQLQRLERSRSHPTEETCTTLVQTSLPNQSLRLDMHLIGTSTLQSPTYHLQSPPLLLA